MRIRSSARARGLQIIYCWRASANSLTSPSLISVCNLRSSCGLLSISSSSLPPEGSPSTFPTSQKKQHATGCTLVSNHNKAYSNQSVKKCRDAVSSSFLESKPTQSFESRHPPVFEVDAESVTQGLRLNNAAQCPFLKEVKDQIQANPTVKAALCGSEQGSGQIFKAVIDDALVTVLSQLREQKRYREFLYFKRSVGQHPEIVHSRISGHNQALSSISDTYDQAAEREENNVVVNWCSNDYLNMGHHPSVIQVMQRTLSEQGAGAGGTRNISGSNVVHVELEKELASLCNTQAALLFGSCYAANLGVMEALSATLGKNTVIFSDQENHASLVQGIRNTRLSKKIFRHNDVQHLRELLEETPHDAKKIVVFESVYSMSGTMSPVSDILDVCDHYGAISVIDEVHAVGLYGSEGGGILDHINQRGRADIITGTLGKAFGVSGGFVAGSGYIIDVIRSTAPSFIFTTSMSPAIGAGALASVRHVRWCSEDRSRMMETCKYIKQRMLDAHLPLMSTETHIMPLLVGEGSLCKKLSDELFARGIYVQPINFPSVPRGEELLRFTAGPKHTTNHIDHLINCLSEIFAHHGLLTTQSMTPKLAVLDASAS